MARYELTCADCGGPHEVSRSDAKYCPACRLLRRLEHATSSRRRSTRCRACNRLFRRYHARDTANCGHCQERTMAKPRTKSCALCSRATAGVEGVPVCLACIKDPDGQPKVIRALRKGQAARREKYADRIAAAEASGRRLRRLK